MEFDAVDRAALIILRAIPDPDLSVYDGRVPETPAGRYVVFYGTAPALYASRLSGENRKTRWRGRCVCVGRDGAEVRHVVSLVLSALAGARVTADRGTSVIRPNPDQAPLLRDESVPGHVLLSQTVTFDLYTTRSPA